MSKFVKINKKCISFIAIYAIFLVAYAVVFLLIPFHKTAVSWISFGVTLFAILAGCSVFIFAFSVKELKSIVYGIPIFKVGVLYSLIQFVCGVIFCVIAAIVDVQVWLCLIVYILLFSAFAIGVILTGNTRAIIESSEQKVVDNTSAMRVIYNSLIGLELRCDSNYKDKLEQIIEDVKYSDPVSVKESEDIETEILNTIENYKLNGGDISTLLTTLQTLLKERNHLCKSYKK